jgi:hypothetical protein
MTILSTILEGRVDVAIRKDEAIREILRNACEHREIAILETPYMRFETSFVRLEAARFHCLANMGLEEAKFGLRSPDLKLRFPCGHHFYEAGVTLFGLGRADNRATLVLGIPPVLEDGETRGAYRAERIGRIAVTFSTRKYQLLMGNLVNISTSGIRMSFSRHYEEGELLEGDVIHVAFTLTDTIRLNAKVRIRYLKDYTFGAEFTPALGGELLERLSRWCFQKREEALAMEQVAASRTVPQVATGEAELILVSPSNELGEQLRTILAGDLPPLRRIPPTIQAIRDLGAAPKTLVLFHVDSPSWETRKRIKTLGEALPSSLPCVLIGTGLESSQLFDLSAEMKAAWAYVLPETPGTLFPRLLHGICKKYFPSQPG